MIIDAHYHIFPPLGEESGGQDPRLTLRFWQYHIRGSALRRLSDGVLVDQPRLDFEGDDIVRDMPDVNFRLGDYGRALVTIDGEDYYTHIYPPGLINMEAPPERMVAEMDLVGVDMGVLQHDHEYGSLNEYYGENMRRYPGRFIGLAQVREWEADRETEHERLRVAVVEQGNKGLYFSVEPFALSNYADHLDDDKFEPFWDVVRELQIPVWWYLHSRRKARLAAYKEHVAELDRWAERHPDIPAVWTHGLDLNLYNRRGQEPYQIPDEVMRLLKRPNMHTEWLGQAFWPEYPYPGAQEMIKRLRDELGGVEKLMWGTDNPFGMTFWCTYRQAIDSIRVHCDLLSQDERDLILGGNAARIFRIAEA